MAVTIQKTQPAATKPALAKPNLKADIGLKEAAIEDAKALVDQIAPAVVKANAVAAKLKKLQTEIDAAKATLLGFTDLLLDSPEDTIEIVGEKGTAKIGKDTFQRKIADKEALIGMLDQVQEGLAFELASFNLGPLDDYLTPEQKKAVIKGEYSGKRSIQLKA